MEPKEGRVLRGWSSGGRNSWRSTKLYLLGKLKLGPYIPNIFSKNAILMLNKKMAPTWLRSPLRSIPPFYLRTVQGMALDYIQED